MEYYQLKDNEGDDVGLVCIESPPPDKDMDLYFKKYVKEKEESEDGYDAEEFCNWLEEHYVIKAMRIFVTELTP